jgi:curved DNA-binding protein CbpA
MAEKSKKFGRFESYYKILGVPDFASIREVKNRAKELGLEEKTIWNIENGLELWKAFSILSDPNSKSEYDLLLKSFYQFLDELNSKKVNILKNLALFLPLLVWTIRSYTVFRYTSDSWAYIIIGGLFLGFLIGILIRELIKRWIYDSKVKKITEKNNISVERFNDFLLENLGHEELKEIKGADKDFIKGFIISVLFICITSYLFYPAWFVILGKKPITLKEAVEKYWSEMSPYINGASEEIKACKGFCADYGCYEISADILEGVVRKIYFSNGGHLDFVAPLNKDGKALGFDKEGNMWCFQIDKPYDEYSIIMRGIKKWAKINNFIIDTGELSE